MEEKKGVEKLKEQIENISEEEPSEEKEYLDEKEQGELEELQMENKSVEETSQKEEEKKTVIKEDSLKEKPPTKKEQQPYSKILIVVLIIAVILLIASIICITVMKKEPEKTALTDKEQKVIIENYGKALENLLTSYHQTEEKILTYEEAVKLLDYDYRIECSEHEIYDNEILYLNDCSIDRVDTTYSYGKKMEEVKVTLKEGEIKVYVSKVDSKATLKEPNNKDDYDIYSFDLNEKHSNLTLLDEMSDYIIYYDNLNRGQIYNYKKQEKGVSGIDYNCILPIKYNNQLDKEYIAVNTNNGWFFYNIITNTKVQSDYYQSVTYYKSNRYLKTTFEIDAVAQDSIVVHKSKEEGDGTGKTGLLNYKTGQEIIPVKYQELSYTDGYFYASEINGGIVESKVIYNIEGKSIIDEQYKILGMYTKDIIFVEKNNELLIINDQNEEIKNIGKMPATFVSYYQSWENKDEFIFSFYETDENGNFIWWKKHEIYYNLKTQETRISKK